MQIACHCSRPTWSIGYPVPVESPQPIDETSQPTALDLANAATRQAIAERQNAEYQHCLLLALRSLGPGWRPWMKLVLIESDYHQKRDRPPVIGATCFKVYRGEQKLTENSRFVIQDADGTVRHAARYEDFFGALLTEKHPTYKLEIRGQQVSAPRWSVCWSAIELYRPMSSEQLAALRVSRERGKAERAEQNFREENPLLAWIERNVDGATSQNSP